MINETDYTGGCVYFATRGTTSAGTILPFEQYPALYTYRVRDTSNMLNVVEWLVSIPAVRVVVGSALTIIASTFLLEMTPLMGMLFPIALRKFQV